MDVAESVGLSVIGMELGRFVGDSVGLLVLEVVVGEGAHTRDGFNSIQTHAPRPP